MIRKGRWFLDVTHAAAQERTTGITRTVRCLASSLETEVDLDLMVYSNRTYRNYANTSVLYKTHKATINSPILGGLFSITEKPWFRSLVTKFPPLVLFSVWRYVSELKYKIIYKKNYKIEFGRGDVIIIADQAWNYNSIAAARAAQENGAFVVWVIYDLIPIKHPEFCTPLFSRVFREWLSEVLTSSNLLMCISRSTQNDLMSFASSLNIELPPLSHFYLGANFKFSSEGKVSKKLTGFHEKNKIFYCCIGTVEPRKNHEMLLDVFETLWKQGIDVGLVLMGKADAQSAQLIRVLQTHKEINGHLYFDQSATDADIHWCYENCRALILPSLAEGFGLPLIEARMYGAQVFANNIPSFIELADDGVLFFDSNDKGSLEKLLKDASLASSYAPITMKKDFSWDKSAKSLLMAIDEFVELRSVEE